MIINAANFNFRELNERIRKCDEEALVNNCLGQRFLAVGQSRKKIIITGTPGNALGAYLDGAEITVKGNAQDAVGDTMNDGLIAVHGNAGDALGYAMRGGRIYVKGNAGYRTGIHMKEYKEKKPVIIIGGSVGSFLGEYLAGGIIIVLGLSGAGAHDHEFTGMGMHGGKIFIRSEFFPEGLPPQVNAQVAAKEDMVEIDEFLKEYTNLFELDYNEIVSGRFYVLRPNTLNPYKRLYTIN